VALVYQAKKDFISTRGVVTELIDSFLASTKMNGCKKLFQFSKKIQQIINQLFLDYRI